MSWPTEYGGGGLSAIEQVVLAEEFARAGAPERAENDLFGIDLLGNTLIALGSEEQKKHFLPRILSGADRWCQGFSEPDAGSDLASVRTRAVRRRRRMGDQRPEDLDIGGADRELDLPAGAHGSRRAQAQGPVDAAGADGPAGRRGPADRERGRPRLVQRGLLHRCPHAARPTSLGGVGDGWSTAMTLLGFERGSQVTTAAIDFGRDLERLRLLARERGLHTDPRIRDGLAWCYSRVQIMRYRGYRGLTSLLNGQRPGADAAITKVIWSEYFRRYTELAAEILGLDALGPQGAGQRRGADGRRGRARRTPLPAGWTNCSTRAPRRSTRAVRRSSAT